MVQWLVKEAKVIADLGVPDHNNFTPIYYALISGNEDIIPWLVSEGYIHIEASIFKNQSLLHFACSRGNLNLVKWLVKKGVNVNQGDNWGHTLLHQALDISVVKWLIDEAGADIFSKTHLLKEFQFQGFIGKSPLFLHIQSLLANQNQEKNHAVIRALLARGAGIKEEFLNIINFDLKRLNLTNCVLIGADIHSSGAIHNNQELCAAISIGVKFKVTALLKAVKIRSLQNPGDVELQETQALLAKYAYIMTKYFLNLKQAQGLSTKGAWAWFLQHLNTDNLILPLDIVITIGSFLMDLSDKESGKVFWAVKNNLFVDAKHNLSFFSEPQIKNSIEYKQAGASLQT